MTRLRAVARSDGSTAARSERTHEDTTESACGTEQSPMDAHSPKSVGVLASAETASNVSGSIPVPHYMKSVSRRVKFSSQRVSDVIASRRPYAAALLQVVKDAVSTEEMFKPYVTILASEMIAQALTLAVARPVPIHPLLADMDDRDLVGVTRMRLWGAVWSTSWKRFCADNVPSRRRDPRALPRATLQAGISYCLATASDVRLEQQHGLRLLKLAAQGTERRHNVVTRQRQAAGQAAGPPRARCAGLRALLRVGADELEDHYFDAQWDEATSAGCVPPLQGDAEAAAVADRVDGERQLRVVYAAMAAAGAAAAKVAGATVAARRRMDALETSSVVSAASDATVHILPLADVRSEVASVPSPRNMRSPRKKKKGGHRRVRNRTWQNGLGVPQVLLSEGPPLPSLDLEMLRTPSHQQTWSAGSFNVSPYNAFITHTASFSNVSDLSKSFNEVHDTLRDPSPDDTSRGVPAPYQVDDQHWAVNVGASSATGLRLLQEEWVNYAGAFVGVSLSVGARQATLHAVHADYDNLVAAADMVYTLYLGSLEEPSTFGHMPSGPCVLDGAPRPSEPGATSKATPFVVGAVVRTADVSRSREAFEHEDMEWNRQHVPLCNAIATVTRCYERYEERCVLSFADGLTCDWPVVALDVSNLYAANGPVAQDVGTVAARGPRASIDLSSQ